MVMPRVRSDSSTESNRDVIDLRSDAVTLPTEAMWEAMNGAKCGWAPSGEDESLDELELLAAELCGKEAALFVPTGTMANLLALMTHTTRGDQIVLVPDSHILWSEEWSLGYICGLVSNILPPHSTDPQSELIRDKLSEKRFNHKPRTSLICLESPHNLMGGVVLPTEQIDEIGELARAHATAVHLDGARLFNGCAATGETAKRVLENVDSVMFCLNKGLSAPAGTMLCGSAKFIEGSRKNLRRVGGNSIPQAGILAAAGTVALRSMIPQCELDNRKAKTLAEGIQSLNGGVLVRHPVQTNIVLVSFKDTGIPGSVFVSELSRFNIRGLLVSEECMRFVTHRHVGEKAIQTVVETIRSFTS
jgi:threonine aldolase